MDVVRAAFGRAAPGGLGATSDLRGDGVIAGRDGHVRTIHVVLEEYGMEDQIHRIIQTAVE